MHNKYSVCQDGGHYEDFDCLEEAMDCAAVLLGGTETPTTFTVEDNTGKVVASFTNRRIIGEFIKQEWGGYKDNTAIEVATEELDATDQILVMSYDDFVDLEDNDCSSDELAREISPWSGPCEFTVEASICEFFGVDEKSQISEELFNQVKQFHRFNPEAVEDKTVTLTVRLKVKVSPGCDPRQALDDLNYSFASTTVGFVVCDSEITDAVVS